MFRPASLAAVPGGRRPTIPGLRLQSFHEPQVHPAVGSLQVPVPIPRQPDRLHVPLQSLQGWRPGQQRLQVGYLTADSNVVVTVFRGICEQHPRNFKKENFIIFSEIWSFIFCEIFFTSHFTFLLVSFAKKLKHSTISSQISRNF